MRRFLLWFGRLFVVSVVLGLVGGYWFANRYYNNEALARRISEGFNKTHRGRLAIRRIHWRPSAILALAKQGHDDVEVLDLRIFDSRGEQVVHVPRAVGRIRLWDIILRGNFFLERLTFHQATVRIERHPRPDGPGPKGEREEIGLVGAFETRPDPKLRGAPERTRGKPKRSFIVVDRFEVSGVQVVAAAGSGRLTLEDLRLGGYLRWASAAGNQPAELRYDLRPRAPRGRLELGKERIALSSVEVRRFASTAARPDRITLEADAQVDLARLAVKGGIRGLASEAGPTVVLTAEAKGFASLLGRLSGRAIREERSELVVDVSGPLADPVADVRLKGLGLDHDRVKARAVEAQARYAGGVLRVHRFASRLLGGTLEGRAQLHTGSGRWRAALTADRLDLAPVLPPGRDELRGRLSGWLDAAGALGDASRGWTRFDLRVDRASPRGPLPPSVRMHGSLHASAERFDVRRLAVESNLLSVDARGRFWPRRQEMDLALDAEAKRLRRFLLSLGKPPLVAAVTLAGRARGRVTNPQFAGRAAAFGVQGGPVTLRSVAAGLALQNGTLTARDVRGRIYGGGLYGQARVDLYRGDVRRLRPQPLLWASGGVAGLDLEPATRGTVEALVNGTFDVRGTPGFLIGRVRARSRLLWAASQWYRDAQLDLRMAGPRFTVDALGVRREAGGHVSASGRFGTGPRGRVDLKVDVTSLPLAAIPGLDRERAPVSGELNAKDLRVLGRFAAPVLEGTVHLVRTVIRGVPAGDGAIRLQSEGDVTAISGDVLSFLRIASGRLDLGREKGVALTLRFTDVPVEKFLPELAAQGNAEGRVSGTLELDVGAPEGIRVAKLTVDKLALKLEKPEDPFEEVAAEVTELKNHGPIVARYERGHVVVDRCVLTDKTDLHRLTIAGALGPRDSQLRVRGRVNLLPLEIILARRFRRLRGVVGVDVTLSGSLAKPRVEGELHPAGILVRTPTLAGDLVVRAGRIRVTNEALSLHGVRLQVVDDEAELNGRVTLKDFAPQHLALSLKGELSPRALEIAAGDLLTRAKGEPSRMDLRITGPVAEPVIRGEIRIGSLQMGLKAASKELALRSGHVEFREGAVVLHDLRGTLDEGPFALNGDVYLKGFALNGVKLHFVGENIPHRSGGTYEVEVSPDVTLTGSGPPETGYTLAGIIDVVEGRYLQKFNINPVSRFLTPSRTAESSGPFYEGSALLENLQLNLTVATTGNLRVKNNIADVGLEGDLSVTGKLPSMRIGGTVDIKEGTFRVPFLRGRYSGASGTIDFDKGRNEGKDEAYVFLEGTTVHTDRSETDHEITLTIQGYLSKLVPTWSSNTGLTSSQVLTLLITSRTPDELRRGRSAALPNLAPLIEDYIPIDLQLDLSSDAVQVFVEQKLGRYFRLKGEAEFGYSGSQRQDGVIVLRLLDQLSLEGRIRRRVQGEDVTEEDDTLSGRVEAKYKIQLRGGLRRALGF